MAWKSTVEGKTNPEVFSNLNQRERPPLGKKPDFNKIDSDRLLALDFEPIEIYPELEIVAKIVNEEINIARKKYGLPELFLDSDTVRLVPHTVYDGNRYARESADAGAFLHPDNRRVFIRFDPAKYSKSNNEKMWQAYVVSHELTHRGMEKGGLSKILDNDPIDLFRMNEGITDYLTRDAMNSRILDKLTTKKVITSRARYVESVKPEIEGFRLAEQDMIPVGNGESELSYSRLPEIRLIEQIKNISSEVFERLVELAFLGQKEKARDVLQHLLGRKVCDVMMNRAVSANELLRMINKGKF